MMAKTKIEWAEATWNPVTGCTKISAGCKGCYAERMTRRFWKNWGCSPPPNHFEVRLHPDRLDQPLRWKKPRMIFVCSMSDLFHEDVPDDFILKVYNVAQDAPQHTYQWLTKRPERALEFHRKRLRGDWVSNIWLGVTAENQETADERIPLLLEIPAAVRFVSVEPMLEPVNLAGPLGVKYLCYPGDPPLAMWPVPSPLNWAIVGGESGPGARPMNPSWARSIRDQCKKAYIPYFFKQWGEFRPAEPGERIDHVFDRDGPDFEIMSRVGRKKAGSLLDGVEHKGFPNG